MIANSNSSRNTVGVSGRYRGGWFNFDVYVNCEPLNLFLDKHREALK